MPAKNTSKLLTIDFQTKFFSIQMHISLKVEPFTMELPVKYYIWLTFFQTIFKKLYHKFLFIADTLSQVKTESTNTFSPSTPRTERKSLYQSPAPKVATPKTVKPKKVDIEKLLNEDDDFDDDFSTLEWRKAFLFTVKIIYYKNFTFSYFHRYKKRTSWAMYKKLK